MLEEPMRQWKFIGICSILLAAAASWHLHAQAPAGGATLFEGARLIVGDGSAPIESSAFIVQGDKITRVGKKGEVQLPAGATRVDLTGKTVIPGLLDSHAHVG